MTRRAVRTAALIVGIAATAGALAAAQVGDLMPPPAAGVAFALLGVGVTYLVGWWRGRAAAAVADKVVADFRAALADLRTAHRPR